MYDNWLDVFDWASTKCMLVMAVLILIKDLITVQYI